MFDSQVFFPIIGKRFVKFSILFFGNFRGLDFFFLGLLFRFSFFFISNFFDFWFISFFFWFIFGFFFFIIRNFLFFFLGDPQRDRVGDEFRVFLDKIFDSSFFKVFSLIIFHVKNDFSSSTKRFSGIRSNGERSSSSRFPSVLFIIIVFGD